MVFFIFCIEGCIELMVDVGMLNMVVGFYGLIFFVFWSFMFVVCVRGFGIFWIILYLMYEKEVVEIFDMDVDVVM